MAYARIGPWPLSYEKLVTETESVQWSLSPTSVVPRPSPCKVPEPFRVYPAGVFVQNFPCCR